MALTNKLTAIADAIREKSGTSALLTLDAMPGAIAAIETGGGSGGGDLPAEAFNITGDCSYLNYNGKWNWFFEAYKNQINITNVENAPYMYGNSDLKEIPSMTMHKTYGLSYEGIFQNCDMTEKIGDINYFKPMNMKSMFMSCLRLRELPNFTNVNMSEMQNGTSSMYSADRMFQDCFSLRSIDKELLKKLYNKCTSRSYTHMYYTFAGCYTLDEIDGLYPADVTMTSNVFTDTFSHCMRVKNIKFATANGTAYTRNWKNQTIDLSESIGWSTLADNYITGYNSGITSAKKVTDEASYNALKNDPDWYTSDPMYSRFNHDSAVELINSLPDVSQGSANTVTLRNVAGLLTDGGSCGSLTEAEIAVATAKGWTITYKT